MNWYSTLSDIFYFLLSVPFWYWLTAAVLFLILLKASNFKRVLIVTSIVIFYLVNNSFVVDALIERWEQKPINADIKVKYETGVVLGGFVSFDNDNHPFLNPAGHRLNEAIKLYYKGVINKILISGGYGEGAVKESDYAKELALKAGIPEGDIIVENKSLTTYENAVFTKRKMDSLCMKPNALLITSAMHIPRAKETFEKAGVIVNAYASDSLLKESSAYFNGISYINFDAFDKCKSLLKEVFGLIAYKLTGKA